MIHNVFLLVDTTAQNVVGVAKGISDYGAMAVMSSVYLLLSASMMIAIFKWFKSVITQIMEDNKENLRDVLSETRKQNELLTDLAEGLRPETQLRIRNLTGFAFDLSVEKVCRLIKRIREENHINNHVATSEKIRKSLQVIHDDRNSKFDTFTYRGKPLSSYCDDKWIDAVYNVVESEVYHEDGQNNARAYTNVSLAYDRIKTEFYGKMKD